MVSEPPARGPDPEITVDLDGDTEPQTASPRARIPNAALAIAAVILVVASGAVAAFKWLPGRDPSSVATVRSFLEAVRDGDPDTALALTLRKDGADDFLVPEAMDGRWTINEVAQVDYHPDAKGGPVAEVYAEIEAYDGTRIGHRYRVLLGGDEPVIHDGLAHTEINPDDFEDFAMNGYAVDLSRDARYLLLLPGLYDFYESAPETLDPGVRPMLLLGDRFVELGAEHSSRWMPTPWPELSEEGLQALQEEVRVFFDGCAERPETEGCPFAPPEGDDRIALDADSRWEITAYPLATAHYSHGADDDGHRFELVTMRPGAVEVDAVVTDADGGERRTTLSCGIWVEGLYATFDLEGGAALRPSTRAEAACRGMVEVA
ncbi:hypothetical protein [Glycomyces tarimensis]